MNIKLLSFLDEKEKNFLMNEKNHREKFIQAKHNSLDAMLNYFEMGRTVGVLNMIKWIREYDKINEKRYVNMWCPECQDYEKQELVYEEKRFWITYCPIYREYIAHTGEFDGRPVIIESDEKLEKGDEM